MAILINEINYQELDPMRITPDIAHSNNNGFHSSKWPFDYKLYECLYRHTKTKSRRLKKETKSLLEQNTDKMSSQQ